MALAWPSWRRWRRLAIGAALIVFVLVLGLRLFAMTPIAHNLIEARLEATEVRGQSIEIEGLKGDLLGKLSVASISVSDSEGVWVTAAELDLGWRPLSYLFDHLRLTEISAQHINIARQPILTPSQAGGGGLARYSFEALSLQRLVLAEGVAGPAQSYTANGTLSATRTQGRLQFDLTTMGERGDDIRADLAWGGVVPITGSLSLEGAPNGLSATFLQAPRDAAVTFHLDSSPTDSEWRVSADATVGDARAMALKVGIADGLYHASGDISLDAIGILSPLRARLGNQVTFDARVDAANALTATAQTESFAATVSGLVNANLDGVVIEDLNVSATDIDAPRLIGSDLRALPSLTANGVLTILRRGVAFDGTVIVPEIVYSTYELKDVSSAGTWSVAPASIASEMRITAQTVRGLPDALAPLLTGPVSMRFSGEFDRAAEQIRARTLLFEGGSLWALGNGSTSLSGAVNFEGEARLSNVAPLASLQARWALTGGSLQSLQLKLNGTANPTEHARTISGLVGDTVRFDLLADRTPNGVQIQSATLLSDQLQASASGALANTDLDIRGRLIVPTLTLGQIEADQVVSNFIVSGPVTTPRLLLTSRADVLQAMGQKMSSPSVTLDAGLSDAFAFKLFGEADVLEAPLKFDLHGSRQDNQIEIGALNVNWRDLAATGRAQVDPATPQNSVLALDVIGTTPVGGAVDAHIDYAADQLDANIAINDLVLGAVDVDNAALSLTGTWPQFEGQLAYQAEAPILANTQNISGLHPLIADFETRSLRINGAADFGDQTLQVTSPLTLTLEPGLQLAGALSGFGGDVEIGLDGSGQSPSTLSLSGIEMSAIGPFVDRPSLRGTLDGAFDVQLVEDALTGQGTARVTGLMRDTVDAKATDLDLQVAIDANQLTAQLTTEDAAEDLNFRADLTAPLSHGSSLMSARLAPNAAIPVSVRGEGAIGPIWALAAPTNLRLDGDLSLDISNGSGESWRFEGPLALSNSTFEDGITGLHLKDISAEAQLRTDGIDIDQLEARGSNGGRVSGSGLYGFDGNGSVTLTLNRLNAPKRSDVSGSLSGTAEVERRNRRTQITGNLEIDEARVNLERLPGAGYTTLDVVFVDEDGQEETDAPAREAVELQLAIKADRRIFVVGSGVDTEWGLDVRVTGPMGRPNIIGRADLIRGEADLLSRRFRFSEGAVRFTGTPTESQISLQADRTDDDITSSILLSGTVTDPEITLSSDPSLPDDEILSRVLFGRSPSELSPLQAAQLAGAAAQLAGGDALNLVGQLQEATGLDRLDIGLDDEGSATLATGKYLADDIYLEIESGVTGAPGVALEWTPLENVAVDAEIDPELGPKVAIQWKRDFDSLPGEGEDD